MDTPELQLYFTVENLRKKKKKAHFPRKNEQQQKALLCCLVTQAPMFTPHVEEEPSPHTPEASCMSILKKEGP